MRIKFLKSLSVSVLSWSLILQLGFGYTFATLGHAAGSVRNEDQANTETPLDREIEAHAQAAAIATSINSPVFRPVDFYLAGIQVRRIYATSPTSRTIDIRLNRVNAETAPINWIGASVVPHYNAENRELVIDRVISGRATDAIVFTNLTVTSTIINDGNMIAFATPEGIRIIWLEHLKRDGRNAVVLAPVVIPNLAGDQGVFTKLELLTPGLEPRAVISEGTHARALDFIVTMQMRDGSSHAFHLDRNKLIDAYRTYFMGALPQLVAANPDLQNPEVLNDLLRIIVDNQAAVDLFRAARAADEEESTTLANQALRNLAQNADFQAILGDISPNQQGQDSFQRLMSTPRHRMNLDPHATGPRSWRTMFQSLSQSWDNDPSTVHQPWQQVVLNPSQNASLKLLKETDAYEGKIKSTFAQKIQAFWSKYATPSRVRTLAAVTAGVAIDQTALHGEGGRGFVALMSRLLDFSLRAPLINIFTKPLSDSAQYFSHLSSATMLVGGAGIIGSFYLVVNLLAKWVSDRQGHNWGRFEALYNYGLGFFRSLLYPLQKALFWNYAAPQIYEALDRNVQLNRRTIGPVLRARNPSDLNRVILDEQTRKARAQKIAALVVSEGRQSVSIADLLMLEHGEEIENYADFFDNSTKQAQWISMTQRVYDDLVRLSDGGVGTFDAQDARMIEAYTAVYNRAADDVERQARVASGGRVAQAAENIRTLFGYSKKVLTRSVLPLLLFSYPAWKWRQKLMGIERLDEQTSVISDENFRTDYIGSVALDALVRPGNFSGIPSAVIWGDYGQQLGVYASTVAPDVLVSAASEGPTLPAAGEPLTNEQFSSQSNREQTLAEAFRTVVKGSFDPNQPLSYGNNQANVMMNKLNGLNANLPLGAIPRFFALLSMVAGERHGFNHLGALDVGRIFVLAFVLEATLIFSKLSLDWNNGPTMGYAIPWPSIYIMNRLVKSVPQTNRTRLQLADQLMEDGLNENDLEMAQEGAVSLQALYEEGHTAYPQEFKVEKSAFTLELVRRFQSYRLEAGHLPVATVTNSKAGFILNWGGTALSTIFYASASTALSRVRDLSAAAWGFGGALARFLGTWSLAKVLGKVTPQILTKAHNVCDQYLTRGKPPVNPTSTNLDH